MMKESKAGRTKAMKSEDESIEDVETDEESKSRETDAWSAIALSDRLAGMPPWSRVLCVTASVIAAGMIVFLASIRLFRAVRGFMNRASESGDWVHDAIFGLLLAAFCIIPLIELVNWLKTRNKRRSVHEKTLPPEGVRLRRCLPSGMVFLAFWCVVWNAGSF